MASEFIADATERLITALTKNGISKKTAGMVAVEWMAGVMADWGGDRPYIGKSSEAVKQMSARDAAILREWHAGERAPTLARKHSISERRVRQIVTSGNALP